MALALTSLLSSGFGAQPDLQPALLGLPITLTAVYLLPPVPLEWFVRQAKRVLLLFAYGSLLAAVVAPQWAVEYPYTEGLIPGFDVRLHGLGSHANLLAPLLGSYLILNWFPLFRTRWHTFHQVVVLLAVILTQSKTVWILLVLAYLIRLVFAAWRLSGPLRYAALALLATILTGGILYLASELAWLENIGVLLGQQNITTFTGRTTIWRVTLNLWEQNPWFGYGPTLWDSRMGLNYAPIVGSPPPHAHSQFYQSLGETGIVGVVGLFLYAVSLLVYGGRFARVTNGVALSLVVVMLLRGFSEPPFEGNPGSSNFYVHFLTFAFLMLVSKRNELMRFYSNVSVDRQLSSKT